jgi:hypothetical protein
MKNFDMEGDGISVAREPGVSTLRGSGRLVRPGKRAKEEPEKFDDPRSHLLGFVAGDLLAEFLVVDGPQFIKGIVAELHMESR